MSRCSTLQENWTCGPRRVRPARPARPTMPASLHDGGADTTPARRAKTGREQTPGSERQALPVRPRDYETTRLRDGAAMRPRDAKHRAPSAT